MKPKLKAIVAVAAVHLASYFAILGILKVSGFQLFTLGSLFGFTPPPHNPPWQGFLFRVAGLLTYPLAWLPDVAWPPANWFTISVAVSLNSLVWGVCLTLSFYAVRRRF